MPLQDEGIRVTASEDEEETSSSEEEEEEEYFEDDARLRDAEIEVHRDIEEHSALTLDKEGEGEEEEYSVKSRNYQKTFFWPLVVCFLLALGAAIALAVLYTLEVTSNDSENGPSSLPTPTILTNAPSPNPQAPTRPPQEVNTVTQEDLYRTTMELFQMTQELSSEELTSWQESTELHLEQYYKSDEGSELESGTFTLHDASSSIRQVLGQNIVALPGFNGTTLSLQIIFEQDLSYQASTFFGSGGNSTTTNEDGIDETVRQGFLLDPFLLDEPQSAYIQRLQRNLSLETYGALTDMAVSSFKRAAPNAAAGVTSSSHSNTTNSNIFDPGENSNSTARQDQSLL